MLERIFIAGSGGQGVLTTGKLLASVAVDHVDHLTFFPSYGAEVRGGTSNCQVVFSSNEIASPVSEEFDTLIIMNQESANVFLDRQTPDALVLLNLDYDVGLSLKLRLWEVFLVIFRPVLLCHGLPLFALSNIRFGQLQERPKVPPTKWWKGRSC